MHDFYNSKMNVAILLAPPASMIHQTQKLFSLVSHKPLMEILTWVVEKLDMYQQAKWNYFTSEVLMKVCRLHRICDLYIDAAMGWDAGDVDIQDRMDMELSNVPAGQGYKSTIHYGQLIDSQTSIFRRFDHGTIENMEKYGQATPPDYDLKSIKVPIALVGGVYDKLADPRDVQWLNE